VLTSPPSGDERPAQDPLNGVPVVVTGGKHDKKGLIGTSGGSPVGRRSVPAVIGGRMSYRDEGGARDDPRTAIEEEILDEFLRWSELRSESSRYLVLETLSHLGGPAHLRDYPTAAQWYLALVTTCSELACIPALGVAAGRVHPPARAALRALVEAWSAAGAEPVDRDEHVEDASGWGLVGGDRPAGAKPATRSKEPPSPASLTAVEIAALAMAYPTPDRARRILDDAGLGRHRQPLWAAGMSSGEYWTEIGELVTRGVLTDGRARILAVARHDFPANPAFARPPPHRVLRDAMGGDRGRWGLSSSVAGGPLPTRPPT
jgi:hypothetical protein